jgi:phage tail-like protein
MVGSDDLFAWLKGVRDGIADPRQITITLLDEARQPVATWALRNAQPKKWMGPTLAAKGGGEVAMEELHFVHEGIDYK